jgi:hypothetical protein
MGSKARRWLRLPPACRARPARQASSDRSVRTEDSLRASGPLNAPRARRVSRWTVLKRGSTPPPEVRGGPAAGRRLPGPSGRRMVPLPAIPPSHREPPSRSPWWSPRDSHFSPRTSSPPQPACVSAQSAGQELLPVAQLAVRCPPHSWVWQGPRNPGRPDLPIEPLGAAAWCGPVFLLVPNLAPQSLTVCPSRGQWDPHHSARSGDGSPPGTPSRWQGPRPIPALPRPLLLPMGAWASGWADSARLRTRWDSPPG